MAFQQSISELLSLLNQERNLIADLYEKSAQQRLFTKPDLLAHTSPERLERMLQREILKRRGNKYELNESLLNFCSLMLRQPQENSSFPFHIQTLKNRVVLLENSEKTFSPQKLAPLKSLLRTLEECLLQEIESLTVTHSESSRANLTKEIRDFRKYLWEEKALEIYRDAEWDLLVHEGIDLLTQALTSLSTLQNRIDFTIEEELDFAQQLMRVQALKAKGKLLTHSNVKKLLGGETALFLENPAVFRPRISSEQVRSKSSLDFLSKFRKKR